MRTTFITYSIKQSIKYSVWTSSEQNNKKFNEAYNEVTKLNDGSMVYMIFSVHNCGCFLGVAQVGSPVDFD